MDNPLITGQPLSRPKVLFLGNGILRAFGDGARGCQDLEKLIYKVSGVESPSGINSPTIPFPMRIAASFVNSDPRHDRLKTAVNDLMGMKNKETDTLLCNHKVADLPLFQRLITAGFTDIITTNYGYEIEKALWKRCPSSSNKRPDFYRSYSYPKKFGTKEYKYKIWKHYRFGDSGPRIWHIHGEYLKPQSIVFEYSDYCSFLVKVKDYPKPNSSEKSGIDSHGEKGNLETNWIKAFHWGDVYILGFGAGMGEPVFWWLMQRKMRRQNPSGKVIFYEPTFASEGDNSRNRIQQQKDILAMMEAFGAEHRDMGVTITKDSQFKEFYQKACEDIIAEVKGSANPCEASERK